MERIAKTICVDNCRSHRNGLLPFVHYGGNGGIFEVNGTMRNGNYGQYICDFTVYSGDTEISRLKYLDVINKYNFIQEQLRNAVFVKRYTYNYVETTKVICDGDNELNNITETRFKTEFEELYTTPTYNFIPLDITLFSEKDGYYLYNGEVFSDDGELFVLLPNFETIKQYNEEWNNWWGGNKKFFNGYTKNNAINENFEFCSDIDTYVLGRIEVVGDISGSKVPKYVYYTEIFDRIAWFKANSASTIGAYNEPTKENMWIITQWEENGGGEFYDYLSSITYSDKWQTFKKDSDTLKYSAPEVSLSVIMNADIEYETLYIPYEYSVIDDALEGVVSEYHAPSSGVGSALTSHFIEFDSANTVYVESQLQSLIHQKALNVSDKIYGVYEYFDEDGSTGQMFKCTYMSGQSSEPYRESGYTYSSYTITDGADEYIGSQSSGPYRLNIEIAPKPYGKDVYVCYLTKEINGETNIEYEETEEYAIKDGVTTGKTIVKSWTAETYYTYYWWNCEKVEDNNMQCADGEIVTSGDSEHYRNVTIVSCIDSLVGKEKNVGGTYWVLARFDNGNYNPEYVDEKGTIKTLEIPYISGTPLNITSYDDGTVVYDMILSTTPNDDGTIIIDYVKGATSGKTVSETGVHYQDIIAYKPNNFDIVSIDGAYPAELYYDTIDLEENKETIYSEEYKLQRDVLKSRITGMEVGTQWVEGGAVEAMLFTKEGTESLQEEPKYNINLLYNRGNAAAWENHFKLSECNTLEDLENYGNNFFNL